MKKFVRSFGWCVLLCLAVFCCSFNCSSPSFFVNSFLQPISTDVFVWFVERGRAKKTCCLGRIARELTIHMGILTSDNVVITSSNRLDDLVVCQLSLSSSNMCFMGKHCALRILGRHPWTIRFLRATTGSNLLCALGYEAMYPRRSESLLKYWLMSLKYLFQTSLLVVQSWNGLLAILM